MPPRTRTPREVLRCLARKSYRDLETGCRIWTGGTTRGGDWEGRSFSENRYGRIWWAGRPWYVHRLYWFLAVLRMERAILPDHHLDHVLDCSTLCFAKEHLAEVPASENLRRAAENTNAERWGVRAPAEWIF